LFETATEDKGVAAFKPDNNAAAGCFAGDQLMDCALADGAFIWFFSNIYMSAVAWRQIKQGLIRKMVVKDHIRFLYCTPSLYREKLGVAGAGPNEEKLGWRSFEMKRIKHILK